MVLNQPARLGELLVNRGLAKPSDVEKALEVQKATGKRLGEALVSLNVLTPDDLAEALSEQLGLSRAPEGFWERPPSRDIPESLVLRHRVFPLRVENGKLYVAVADPLDVRAADEFRYATGLEVVPEVATQEEIDRAVRRWYGTTDVGEFPGEEVPEEGDDAAEGPAAKLAEDVIAGALAEGASDVHIEPEKSRTVVRYRVDGTLRDVMEVPRKMHAPLVSRIKVMAGMDIAEKRLPQDGRIRLKRPREVDLRVSTLPTVAGEAVVLRILDRTRTVPKLDALGYSGENLEKLRRAVKMPYGLVLLTGPTGSGKTTTLYAALSEVVSREINVITVEDPPEYELPSVRQVAVNPKAGLTFASALRAILRQDPDVIMVGEIRDPETAKIAVQAAMTGHLVLSTLHTNDAASAPVRLVDMGVEPYLAASCLLCVAAQRLVRLVCPKCAEEYVPSSDSPAWGFLNGERVSLRRGKGCPWCGHTGYRGRTAVTEVMAVTRGIRELVRKGASADEVKTLAVSEGMVLLGEEARKKVLAGLTTPEEAMRVAASAED
ncbi:Flp pilus assembly complex ATPase component TadA [Desulfofundulus sp. TPOSR]|uniref:GspE/PulE family protein n=1 Tax=Desulfofundulus sp. TPOSR TaxID=2714340 RepID=UPI0014084EFB|nr:GspE/PulE family protein [Desulfofundulus sp. TPOSR]NHM28137.1 Flp pilus assembly complex ATPase component TadA [Desulfofundulus sp. TPOSR]